MAGGKSIYLSNALLDAILGAQAFPSLPATLYLAAFTVAPSAGAIGGTEASGGSYARKAITNNLTNFPAASSGAKSNGTDIEFVRATADWGEINAVVLFDASSGGNRYYWATLTTPKTITNNDKLVIEAGEADFSES